MLVLTRKTNQQLVIGDNIRITVLGIKGNMIRLGIEAPPEVRVLRNELADAPRTATSNQATCLPSDSCPARGASDSESHSVTIQIDRERVCSRTADERCPEAPKKRAVQTAPLTPPAGLSAWVQMVRAN